MLANIALLLLLDRVGIVLEKTDWTELVLAQILSVYTKKSLAAGVMPQTLLGELTTFPKTLKSDPRRLAPVALAPYDSHFWLSFLIAVPRLWSP